MDLTNLVRGAVLLGGAYVLIRQAVRHGMGDAFEDAAAKQAEAARKAAEEAAAQAQA